MAAAFYLLPGYAQNAAADSCAELKAAYNQLLYTMDSVIADQMKWQKQGDSLRLEISNNISEVRSMLKRKKRLTQTLGEPGTLSPNK